MQAIRTNPEDPLQHQFGHSVRAVFSSACATISGLISIHQTQPQLIRRFPIAWSHGFSAAVGALAVDVFGGSHLSEIDSFEFSCHICSKMSACHASIKGT